MSKFKKFGVNLTAQWKEKMNEDENLAVPKWMGLNADEKILCEFELVHTVHKEVSFDTAFIRARQGL